MKKIIMLLMITLGSQAQETEFKLNSNGFTDYIVTSVEGKTASELYKKTLNWINLTYKNPKEVLKANIENDYIRFIGSSYGLFSVTVMGSKFSYDTRYTIEVSFKDGKYKFDIIDLEYYLKPGQYSAGGWDNVGLDKIEEFYNKKGEIKSRYKYLPETIPNYFNSLNKELKIYLTTEETATKKNDW